MDDTKRLSKFKSIARDFVVILMNLGKMDFSHLIPFVRTKYFESPRNIKAHQSLYFFKVRYLLFKQKFVFETLLEYWQKYRCFSKVTDYIGMSTPNFQRKYILDVGCGYTSVLNILPESNKYGIDIVINLLSANDFALDKGIKWIDGQAENLPFKTNSFDIIFCTNGIDHFGTPERGVSEIRRVLKRDGLFILTVDVFDKNIGYRDIEHPHSFSENEVISILKLKDFEILSQECLADRKLGVAKFLWSKVFREKKNNSHQNFNYAADKKELMIISKSKKG